MASHTTTTTTTRSRRGGKSPLLLGFAAFLVLIATLFVWLSAFSVPYIRSIHYIHTRENDVKFGNSGWCAGAPLNGLLTGIKCHRHVGYNFRPWIPGGKSATGALILVALTAGFGSLAFFSLLHSATNIRSGAASFGLTLFTTLLATISFFLVVIVYGTAHRRFNHDNLDAHYGAAFVLVILGWLIYLLTIPLIFLGWFKNRRQHTTNATIRGDSHQTTNVSIRA
ncbi:uncharacterized protein I206_100280 [Kwoniella pini CBS 10737]|uniref:Pali-domain-containing protein n=1 Tax=Kwoniella pini CBS 10737 TaxID=1296096 RepID=A0A1B9IDG7_9TREE|nr:uncharacterized protein I206_01045 [Kwoniella pini CBS 10737]OCF53738.1 hypothetical protein I206_01045 [Kwoniella pini CBS 10737]